MKPYLLVTGDFAQTGGMDMANYALACHVAEQGNEVHLVTHRAAEDLAARPNLAVHRVPKPAGSYLLAGPLLDHFGRYWAARIAARGGRVVVNGGNCRWGDINWVHYVHAAYVPQCAGSAMRKLKSLWGHQRFLADERESLRRARVVITNSERTKRDVVERLSIPVDRVHTVHYGIDGDRFHPPTAEERATARAMLGWPNGKIAVGFVGGLGDRRKGFDTVFTAWKMLCADSQWDADLAVIGAGSDLRLWKSLAIQVGLDSRIHFLGFRRDVSTVLTACDALVGPARYEAYGLGVQEALCCGLPALVTRTAGVAERYPPELHDLLIPDPDDAADLAKRLRDWRARAETYRAAVASLSQRLRAHTWDHMAAQIVDIIEAAA